MYLDTFLRMLLVSFRCEEYSFFEISISESAVRSFRFRINFAVTGGGVDSPFSCGRNNASAKSKSTPCIFSGGYHYSHGLLPSVVHHRIQNQVPYHQIPHQDHHPHHQIPPPVSPFSNPKPNSSSPSRPLMDPNSSSNPTDMASRPLSTLKLLPSSNAKSRTSSSPRGN